MNNSVFGRIADVQVTQSAPYFEPGTYHLRALRMVTGISQQGKGPFFVGEFEIVDSNVPSRPAGSKVAQVMYFTKGDVVLANIKAMAAALLGCDHAQITAPVMEQLVSGEGTAIAGRTCWAEAAMVKTRQNTDFTRVTWHSDSAWSTMGRTMPAQLPPSAPAATPAASPQQVYNGFNVLPAPGPQQPGFQQPGFQQPGFQQPGFQQPGFPLLNGQTAGNNGGRS